jgi:hypothetical protein
MDERAALIEEEKLGCDTPLDSRIHTAPLPLPTSRELEVEAERVYAAGKGIFKDMQEAEYFSMLPLTKRDRLAVIKRTFEIQREEQAAKAAWLNKQERIELGGHFI